ncbi:MAG: hypothetical protein BWY89_01684 [Bacteroidetes bacterium ADurb.BinA012]|nr:MAG: hypothetical protein BWY89_01684 [Bacteroidetes bacterium ADurb.BinA012]
MTSPPDRSNITCSFSVTGTFISIRKSLIFFICLIPSGMNLSPGFHCLTVTGKVTRSRSREAVRRVAGSASSEGSVILTALNRPDRRISSMELNRYSDGASGFPGEMIIRPLSFSNRWVAV